MSEHHCHANGCKVRTKPELLMCGQHWGMVPTDMKQAIWRHYRPGQCDDKEPSAKWYNAAAAAVEAVARKEGLPVENAFRREADALGVSQTIR